MQTPRESSRNLAHYCFTQPKEHMWLRSKGVEHSIRVSIDEFLDVFIISERWSSTWLPSYRFLLHFIQGSHENEILKFLLDVSRRLWPWCIIAVIDKKFNKWSRLFQCDNWQKAPPKTNITRWNIINKRSSTYTKATETSTYTKFHIHKVPHNLIADHFSAFTHCFLLGSLL